MDAEIIIEQNKELDIILTNTSVGIVLTHQGRIKRSNPYFQELLGYSEFELDNRLLVDMIHSDEKDDLLHLIQRMDNGG